MTSETKLGRARLPRKASPAKEAKDGQHNKDDDDDPNPTHCVPFGRSAPTLLRADPYLQRARPTPRAERIALD